MQSHPTSPSGTWFSSCKTLKQKALLRTKSATATFSSPLAPAAHAASECTKRNIASRCATPALKSSACCSFNRAAALNQAEAEAGLEMNMDFFLAILNALNMGDILNDLAYQIRPYEMNAGETDRVLEESMEMLHDVMRRRQPWTLAESQGRAKFLAKTRFAGTAEYLGKFLHQIFGDDLMAALRQVRDRFATIEIDRTRVKPIVKITGEFWAQTTEGDGNFNMFRFLEKEGAQVVVEPIGTWICYLMHQVVQKYQDQKGLDEGAAPPPSWRLDKHLKIGLTMRKKIMQIKIAETIFKREYNRIIEALGGIGHHLVDQYELQRPRPSLLQLARSRRRRPPRSRQEYLLLDEGPRAHGSRAEAFRLHAFHAV